MGQRYSQRIRSSYVVYVCVLLLLVCISSVSFIYLEWIAVRQHSLSSEQQFAQLAANNLSHIAGRTVTHVTAMRSSIENALEHPQFPDTSFAARLHTFKDTAQIAREISSDFKLSVFAINNPDQLSDAAVTANRTVAQDMVSALHFLDIAKSAHAKDDVIQWSYYYDKQERFVYLYPVLPETELIKSTKTDSGNEALTLLFKQHSSQLWQHIQEADTHANKLLWKSPYLDNAGKGMMISLLGPVYTAHALQGAVGADITLNELNENLRHSVFSFGRALLLDQDDNVLADSVLSIDGQKNITTLKDIFGEKIPVKKEDQVFEEIAEAYWLKLAVEDTPWHLLLRVSKTELEKIVWKKTESIIAMNLAFIIFFIIAAIFLHKKYTYPAILLTVFLQELKENTQKLIPSVPPKWRPIFLGSAKDEQERVKYLYSLKQDAEVLEQRVQERTAELEIAYSDLEENRDELDLANANLVETLATLEATKDQLMQTEKLAALGKLVAGISHVLNTPLGNAILTVSTTLEGARERAAELEQGQMKKSSLMRYFASTEAGLQLAQKNLEKAAHIVYDLKQLGHEYVDTVAVKVKLLDLFKDIKLIFSRALLEGGHSLQLEMEDISLELVAHREALIQVFSLLIQNSLTHGFADRRDGKISIHLQQLDAHLLIVYQDNGCGMEADQLSHLFDPFYTSRLGQGSSGLGAFAIYSIVTGVLRGQISVSSELGAGLRYEMRIASMQIKD